MAPSMGGAWRSFWHTMVSSDRHASHNSSYRTGQRADSRHAPLTSITSASNESRTDVSSQESTELSNGYRQKSVGDQSPVLPYAPGSRSALQKTNSSDDVKSSAHSHAGEIQMQNFTDGLPPPPPVSHSWDRIDRWAENIYEELYDNLGGPCTQNDMNELEHELDCTLPLEIRDSLQIHDGQERGGLPTGIIFGCMLLDCEEIVQEWKNWKQVNEQYLSQPVIHQTPQSIPKAFGSAPSSSSNQPSTKDQMQQSNWREELLSRQDSQPPNAIQKAYAHPAWIPLARDWGGNCLAVDLAPAPAGKWGQVILMGRDYDCKYVVARSWAAFLAVLADDLCSKMVIISEETGDLKLGEFKQQGVEPGYLDILRWRADQKYGRKVLRKRPNDAAGLGVGAGTNRSSPYSNKNNVEQDRGRQPQRLNPKAPEKRGSHSHISSPLARVTEEGISLPIANLQTNTTMLVPESPSTEKLISPLSPKQNDESPISTVSSVSAPDKIASTGNGRPVSAAHGLGVKNVDVDDGVDSRGEMTTVDI